MRCTLGMKSRAVLQVPRIEQALDMDTLSTQLSDTWMSATLRLWNLLDPCKEAAKVNCGIASDLSWSLRTSD